MRTPNRSYDSQPSSCSRRILNRQCAALPCTQAPGEVAVHDLLTGAHRSRSPSRSAILLQPVRSRTTVKVHACQAMAHTPRDSDMRAPQAAARHRSSWVRTWGQAPPVSVRCLQPLRFGAAKTGAGARQRPQQPYTTRMLPVQPQAAQRRARECRRRGACYPGAPQHEGAQLGMRAKTT